MFLDCLGYLIAIWGCFFSRLGEYVFRKANVPSRFVAKGQQLILLVMATGTGKTYTAFEIIWCLWKLGDNLRVQNNLSQ